VASFVKSEIVRPNRTGLVTVTRQNLINIPLKQKNSLKANGENLKFERENNPTVPTYVIKV